MKATFALLTNPEIYNYTRKLSWGIHQKYRTGTRHAAHPPHISLRRPFSASSVPALEQYMEELASSVQPFEVKLTELQAVPKFYDGVEYGVLWAAVEKSYVLRELHKRLNHDLELRFGCDAADPDSDSYLFHITIMMCGQLMEICRKYENNIEHTRIDMCYTARELGMFIYEEPMGPHGEYLCYKILPIGAH